jgi:hypothetical protein
LQIASPNSLLTGKITGKLVQSNFDGGLLRYSIAGIDSLSLILTPPEVVTLLNSLLTGKTTGSYLNFMFERGLVRYRSVNPVIDHRIDWPSGSKTSRLSPRSSPHVFYLGLALTGTITASTNSRVWKRLVDGRTFEGSDSQPGLLKFWRHALISHVTAHVL